MPQYDPSDIDAVRARLDKAEALLEVHRGEQPMRSRERINTAIAVCAIMAEAFEAQGKDHDYDVLASAISVLEWVLCEDSDDALEFEGMIRESEHVVQETIDRVVLVVQQSKREQGPCPN